MTFKEGFEAIEQINKSGRKLGDFVERIEGLTQSLEELRSVQAGVETALAHAKETFASLANSAEGLSGDQERFQKLAQKLPETTEEVLEQAEKRVKIQQAEVSKLVNRMPQLVESVVKKELNAILMQLEGRLSNLLRDELKDTRSALRDAFEVNARAQDTKLDSFRQEIIAEMPRTLFGRRGR